MARLRLLHCIRAQKSNRIHAMILRWTLVLPFLCLRAIAITFSLEATHAASQLSELHLAFALSGAAEDREISLSLGLTGNVWGSRSSFDQH